jgi:adenylate cyclase
MSTFGEALLQPGDNERDLGLRFADTLRHLGPLAAPTLGRMLNQRLREVIRDSAVGQAELHSGHLPGAQAVTVGFVDIVGFTRLGEEIPPEDLGEVVREFERSVERVTEAPVRLVKTIGDAAMLVAPTPKPVVDAILGLVEESRGEDRPMLRGGVASGEAIPRVGDWYGRPVNLASRLTSFARRGSVVASKDVHDAMPENGYAWSFAGNRRFKGLGEEVPVYRVRPAEPSA